MLIAFGNGCIRACITSLGGSQFELPRQQAALDQYFSHYYFIYTFGIFLSKLIPPEIRDQTHCFGQNQCYVAVFGSLFAIFGAAWGKFYKLENKYIQLQANPFLLVTYHVIYFSFQK